MRITSFCLLFLSLSIISNKSLSQNRYIGFNTGMEYITVSNQDFYNIIKPGFKIGLNYEYRFKNHISLSIGLAYDQKRFGESLIFGDQLDALTGTITNDSLNHLILFQNNFLSIPLKFGYYFGNKFYGFGRIGLSPSVLFNPLIIYDSEKRTSNNPIFHQFDLLGQVDIGCGYKFKEKLEIMAYISVLNSLTPTFDSWFYNISNRYGGSALSIGLYYQLLD